MIIYQPIDGYCYNSDTIFLYDFILKFKLKGNVLDVGSGSGILALLVARDYNIDVTAVEKQEFMANYAKINAKANKIDLDIKIGNFQDIEFEKRFDFVISNPPFYHKNVLRSKNKKIDISRYELFLPLEDFLKKTNSIIKPKGAIIFCYDAKQIQKVITLLSSFKFNLEGLRFIHPKRDKESNLALFYAKKSSKSLAKIFPPLTLFEDNKYTKEALNAFKNAGVHSIKCKI